MSLQPGTKNQIPDNSILDYFNKQVYLGQQFQVSTNTVSLTGTTEVPFVYFLCQAGQALSLFHAQEQFGMNDPSGATAIIYRAYLNPTGISGGSTLTPINLRSGDATPSIATVKLSPTATTKGNLIATYTVGWGVSFIETSLVIVDPGTSILFTAQPTGTTTGLANFTWYEL